MHDYNKRPLQLTLPTSLVCPNKQASLKYYGDVLLLCDYEFRFARRETLADNAITTCRLQRNCSTDHNQSRWLYGYHLTLDIKEQWEGTVPPTYFRGVQNCSVTPIYKEGVAHDPCILRGPKPCVRYNKTRIHGVPKQCLERRIGPCLKYTPAFRFIEKFTLQSAASSLTPLGGGGSGCCGGGLARFARAAVYSCVAATLIFLA